jgi:hypothetical protein
MQIQRQVARDGCGRADAEAKVAAQMPLEEKLWRAELVITNSADTTLEDLNRQVEAVRVRLRRGALLPGLLLSPVGLAAVGYGLFRAGLAAVGLLSGVRR